MKFRPTAFVASIIWRYSERWNIPLGRFAPHVFGAMMGSKAVKINRKPKRL